MAGRDTYNVTLMESADYSMLKGIKILLSKWKILEELAYEGDQVALSILIDLKSCLGYYKSKTLLTPEEIRLVKYNLIYGVSQDDIAKDMGVSQKTISVKISDAVFKMRKMLEGGLNG